MTRRGNSVQGLGSRVWGLESVIANPIIVRFNILPPPTEGGGRMRKVTIFMLAMTNMDGFRLTATAVSGMTPTCGWGSGSGLGSGSG